MADLLFDTDIFVDHLRGARRISSSSDGVHYSVVTRAELFAGRGSEGSRADLVLAPVRELTIDRAVAERAGRLRRATGLRLPDALIAATAIENGCLLVTRNVRDFQRIPGLQLRSPRVQGARRSTDPSRTGR